jgi:two-component system response regulator VicR
MLMKKILVVDDEPDVRETVKLILEQKGYKVSTAADGDECMKKLNEETPDLILLDIMMPGMPIDEVVKKIEDTKIAFMSIVRISEARKKGLCKQDNVVDFIQKPFDVLELIQRVNLILNEKTS